MQRGVQLVLKYLIIVVKRALRVREVEKLIMCETKEKGSSRKSYGHTNVLVDMMQNYPGFMDYIAYQYPLEGERIELLEQILTALAVGRKLEAEQMIYHYGSMIHGRDLIARQVFLWLLGMAEYSRRECIAEERRYKAGKGSQRRGRALKKQGIFLSSDRKRYTIKREKF